MIELKNISKTLKKNRVLDNVSYRFESGKVYGFYGENGSGKTMLLRAISGLLYLDEGEIICDGCILHKDISFPPDTGIVIEHMELLPNLTGKENLHQLASIKKTASESDIINALVRVGLDENDRRIVKKYSLGMKQRLNIAQAIFEKQKLILLDEPTNALDEEGVQRIYQIIREEKERGALIIIATHHRQDLEQVCDIVLRIQKGRIVEEAKL